MKRAEQNARFVCMLQHAKASVCVSLLAHSTAAFAEDFAYHQSPAAWRSGRWRRNPPQQAPRCALTCHAGPAAGPPPRGLQRMGGVGQGGRVEIASGRV